MLKFYNLDILWYIPNIYFYFRGDKILACDWSTSLRRAKNGYIFDYESKDLFHCIVIQKTNDC